VFLWTLYFFSGKKNGTLKDPFECGCPNHQNLIVGTKDANRENVND
jgi:hypothetical protein